MVSASVIFKLAVSFYNSRKDITYWVGTAEPKLQAKRLPSIQRVLVQHFDIHQPVFETISRRYRYAWRRILVELRGIVSNKSSADIPLCGPVP